jgi:hypothetical protein
VDLLGHSRLPDPLQRRERNVGEKARVCDDPVLRAQVGAFRVIDRVLPPALASFKALSKAVCDAHRAHPALTPGIATIAVAKEASSRAGARRERSGSGSGAAHGERAVHTHVGPGLARQAQDPPEDRGRQARSASPSAAQSTA